MNIQASESPIVIVDDSDADLLVARRCYERSRLENPLLVLPGGEALLAHLDRVEAGTEPMPSLVLLDINMPGLDGFETLARIRSRTAFRNLPVVVMLTNSDNPKDVERASAEGASGFQVKPMDISEYVAFFDSLASEGD